MSEERISWRRKAVILAVPIGIVFVAVAFLLPRTETDSRKALSLPSGDVEPPVFTTSAGEVPGRVLADENATDPSLLSSENFRLGDIVVGGDVTIAAGADNDRYLPLEVTSVRGESMEGKNKNEARILVTWKTSKAANSTIRYGKNTDGDAKAVDEDGYGVNHSVVLSGLDQASTYIYTITVRDRWSNEAVTDSYAVYTGAKNVSLFELISGALSETFGWAFRK